MQSYKFIVEGKVQKVYYRKTVCENAIKFNFSGYVKNLSDGSVEACVTTDRVDEFVKILEAGSKNSVVKKITKKECSEVFEGSFEVRK